MISTVSYSKRKWIHIFLALVVIVVLIIFTVTIHTDTTAVNQAMGKTIVKFKEFAGINDQPLFQESSTMEPFEDNPDKNQDGGVEKIVHYSVPTNININNVLKKRFDERIALKKRVCSFASYKDMANGANKSNGYTSYLGNRRIRWCRIPKVGTTYLKGLEKRVLKAIAQKNSNGIVQPKSFMMVREPYSRLMSGYMGKIVTNPPWQRGYGANIVEKFRPLASANSKSCGHDVTFPEFLKYFIEAETTGWRKNRHFVPMYKQCNPCSSGYDYIGHLETIKDDLAYILKSVDIPVDMDFSDEESTTKGKARDIIRQRDRSILQCESMCSALSKVWWSFHARGLISTELPFPLKDEQCNKINETEFADLVWDAHLQSSGRINKPKQRREALVSLYLQAPLQDRLKVQELMWKDFELYGYDPQPDDLFPELKQNR